MTNLVGMWFVTLRVPMRPLRAVCVALFCLVLVAGGTSVRAQSGADLAQACVDNGGSAAMCRGLYQTLRIPGGLCRDVASNAPECAVIDGIEIDEALVRAQERSWLNRALALQTGLDDREPLHDELWPHTHNSFNADAYATQATGGLDRNHKYSIRDQLRLGARAVEIDLHWTPDLLAGGANAVLVCHGQSAPTHHLGCEIGSPSLAEHLSEIRAGMKQHPNEVVLLYLENDLADNKEAHDIVASAISKAFGSLVLKPSKTCAALPMDTSRKQIRDGGKRILVTGNCGPGGWGAWVHERGPRWKEGGLDYGDDYPAYPACETRRRAENSAHNWTRHYGDETGLSAGAGAGGDVTPNDALRMARCGVNMLGWDNLVPFDQRMTNIVWSWRTNEPSKAGACAAHGSDGRFYAADCAGSAQRYVCWNDVRWAVTKASGAFVRGDAACAAERLGRFAVPRSGYENELVKKAKGTGTAWLDYRLSGGAWRA